MMGPRGLEGIGLIATGTETRRPFWFFSRDNIARNEEARSNSHYSAESGSYWDKTIEPPEQKDNGGGRVQRGCTGSAFIFEVQSRTLELCQPVPVRLFIGTVYFVCAFTSFRVFMDTT
jgi:hypothetical protein